MRKAERVTRWGSVAVCEVLALVTLIYLIGHGEGNRLLLAVVTPALILLPALLERLLARRIALPVYLFCLVYAIGPMLGHCWNFYYLLPGWDKLLHICGGVVFALVGYYLFELLGSGKRLLSLLGALCFSIAIAALWELTEFGLDQLLHMDMQNDTYINAIYSYELGEGLGVAGSIENIQSVTVNGQTLAGYLDIGLIDSMMDMLLETLGAVLTVVLLWIDKNKHPLLRMETERE